MGKRSPNGHPKLERNKKKKALNSEEYKAQIENLAKRGVTPEEIQAIYDKCQQRSQTKTTRHTLVSKLLQILEYFDTRNEGIETNRSGYISKNDAIEMIMKNPRIMSSDIENNFIVKCQIVTRKKDGNTIKANELIKSNPGLFRKTAKKIIEGK